MRLKIPSILMFLLCVFISEVMIAAQTDNRLFSHIRVVQELKQKFAEKNVMIHEPTSITNHSKLPTQTEAYLSVYKEHFEPWLQSQLKEKEYKNIVDHVLQREKKYNDTHYIFYHAHERHLMVLHDFIKEVDTYLNIVHRPSDFTFVRCKTHKDKFETAQEYIDSKGGVINDHEPSMQWRLMAVNLALFGNHANWGECTFRYFCDNRNVRSFSLRERIKSVFDVYHFDEKYLDELVKLESYLSASTGNLLQICIPKESVDSIVYVSEPYGRPYSNIISNECYDSAKQRHTKIAPILDLYRKDPHSIKDLDTLQARIVMTNEMFDPTSDIKMFRYNMVSPENTRIYEQKLHDIVARMMQNYLKKGSLEKIPQPLFKLHEYVHNCPNTENKI